MWKRDRLGRSLRDLIAMLDGLRDRGVKFRSLTEAIDTTTPTGRAIWQMIGVLAELETQLDRRTDTGRNDGSTAAVREIRQEEEVNPGADRQGRKLIEAGEGVEDVAALCAGRRFTERLPVDRFSATGRPLCTAIGYPYPTVLRTAVFV
jgi:DNA invertase Pin-like site-specific DNA recombinase